MVTDLLPMTVEGLEVRKGGRSLLGPVDISLKGRGITMVIGPNGAGKTTLLRAMHGLEKTRAGRVRWACDSASARAGQAFVFQTPRLMRRTVVQNVAYPLMVRGTPRSEAHHRAQSAIARVGLEAAQHLRAARISGGEKQKMALVRALITAPQVLFLDEPTSSLDGAATRDIEAILLETVSEGTRVVMSTHDLGQARRLADEVIFLVAGQLVEQGPAASFFEHPQTPQAQAFLNGEIVL